MNFTIRPNTAGTGWAAIHGRQDIPVVVAQVRETARPKLLDAETVEEVQAWIEQMGWEPHDSPVFLEPLE